MVGHPIDHQLHACFMNTGNQFPEIIPRTKFRVYFPVIPDGIVTAEASLPVLLADRVNRHEPQDICAHIFDPGDMLHKCSDGACGGKLPQVDLIDNGTGQKRWCVECCQTLRLKNERQTGTRFVYRATMYLCFCYIRT